MKPATPRAAHKAETATNIEFDRAQAALSQVVSSAPAISEDVERYPGPVGEANELRLFPRGTVLCLGPTTEDVRQQVEMAQRFGNAVLAICPHPLDLAVPSLTGRLPYEMLQHLKGVAAVISFAGENELVAIREALAAREGAIIPLVSRPEDDWRLALERHFCSDLTAAGGDVQLIASASA